MKRLALVLSLLSAFLAVELLLRVYSLRGYPFLPEVVLAAFVAYAGYVIQMFNSKFNRLYSLLKLPEGSPWRSRNFRRFVAL